MKCAGFVLTDENDEVLAVSVDGSSDLVKAHVHGYTRKDGTYVKEHDDSRTGSSERPSLGEQGKPVSIPSVSASNKATINGHDYIYHKGIWKHASGEGGLNPNGYLASALNIMTGKPIPADAHRDEYTIGNVAKTLVLGGYVAAPKALFTATQWMKYGKMPS